MVIGHYHFFVFSSSSPIWLVNEVGECWRGAKWRYNCKGCGAVCVCAPHVNGADPWRVISYWSGITWGKTLFNFE